MDFVIGLPQTQKQQDSIRVVVDWLTKTDHVIPFKSTFSVEYYVRIFIDDIVYHHGIALIIISDRGS